MIFIIIMRHFLIVAGIIGLVACTYEYFTEKKITRELAKAYRSDMLTMTVMLIIGLALCIQ